MTGKIYFIFGSSFFMGILCGAYLYVTVFAPEYDSSLDITDETSPNALVIEGSMYGGCQETDTCASFKLTDDRKYQYLAAPSAKVVGGKIPEALRKTVFTFVGTNAFFTASKEIQNDSCAAYVDGTDYLYDVTFEGKTYTLDTCATQFAYTQEQQETFLSLWQFMANPVKTDPAIIEKGFGGLIFDRFNNGAQ